MIYENIEVRVEAGVAVVELNRPARRNAYTPDMGQELVSALRCAINDEEVRAVILTGTGPTFCAGADREYLSGKRGKCGLRLGEEAFITSFVVELSRSNTPLIAAINGAAIGIGVTMMLPFDIRIAASDASFGFPYAQLGMIPAMGATHIMQRLLGYAKTAELLLCSSIIEAPEALAIGLVNKVTPPDQLMSSALELAAKIVASPRASIAATRRALIFAAHSSLGAAIANEHKENEELRETRESVAETYAASPESLKKAWRGLH
ncbi:MAG: enoyl-CoA hydratase/isomerase family protein [Pseudomonadota bacterium]